MLIHWEVQALLGLSSILAMSRVREGEEKLAKTDYLSPPFKLILVRNRFNASFDGQFGSRVYLSSLLGIGIFVSAPNPLLILGVKFVARLGKGFVVG